MRYLSLLLLLLLCSCLNPSQEIHNSFEKINNSVQRSSATAADRLDSLRTAAKAIAGKPGTTLHAASASYDRLILFTDSITNVLQQGKDDDMQLVNKIMIREKVGQALYYQLEQCYTDCHAAVEHAATIDTVFSWPPEEKNPAAWAKACFHNMPAYAAVTLINKLKLDAANALTAVLQEHLTPGRR